MVEFYRVIFGDCSDAFFKTHGKALDYLWQAYLNQLSGDETEEEIDKARQELNEFDEIYPVGMVYTEHFED